MTLPTPGEAYSKVNEAQTRAQIDQMDKRNRKQGQDVEIAGDERLILTDTVTGDRGTITVASGVLVWTPL
jgi:hypothetical protein